jgi:molecular chaperone DnaK
MSEGVTIGIDLGTSNSCVAALINRKPQVLASANGERTIPSVIHFAEDGTITVGRRAKARVILDPPNTVSSAKRLIGRYAFSEEVKKARAVHRYQIVDHPDNSIRVKIRNEEFAVPEISAFVLREMKRIAEFRLGRPVSKAVITVPAYFNDNQRQATKDAGRIAGLEVQRILNEPTAAALCYGYGRRLKQRVAVYDLGGGTFDISVLEIGDDVFEVLSTCGDTYLGGDDFDDRLIDLLADEVQARHKVNVRADPIALEKLKVAAESAKIGLSQADEVQIEITGLLESSGRKLSFEYRLERPVFDQLTRDLIQRTFKVCDEALQQAGLTVRDLDGLILVGGSTRMPSVRHAVREYFGREPEVDVNPDEVVAVGAAIHGASLEQQVAETYLLDVTPLSLRLGIAGGMTETIIERNSPVPIEQTRIFNPARDQQRSVSVQIFQGETRKAAGNELLGEFEFSGFNPGPRDQVQIEVCFEISTEGIVKVSARNPRTGVAHATTVSMSSGLSEQEIQAIVERGRMEAVERGAPVEPQHRDAGVRELLAEMPLHGVRATPSGRGLPEPSRAGGGAARSARPAPMQFVDELEGMPELDAGGDLAPADSLDHLFESDFDFSDDEEKDR